MKNYFLISGLAAALAIAASAEPPAMKQPSPEEVAKMEQAAPLQATARPLKSRKVLVINQCEGFPHASIPYASKAFEVLGRKTGAFTTVAVDDLSILEQPEFDTFDAIIMNNTTLKLPLLAGGDEAREAKAQKRFVDFVRNGKGLVGVHAATDCLYQWPAYGELIGGYFDGHPWNEEVRVKLDDPGHPLLAGFKGLNFTVADEIYQFKSYSRDALHVLMSLDVTQTDMKKEHIKRTDNDFAVAWIHEYGKGRVFYFSLGHRNEIFWTPAILRCYLDGIQYALGDLPADATPSSKLTPGYLEQSRLSAFELGMGNMLAELAGYTPGGSDSVAKQVDEFVDKHLTDSPASRDALSKGLAKVAANPQATRDGRALACRKLSLVGTDNAVPALGALIADPEMGDWARYALARMPGQAADQALAEALKSARGNARLAVVALLGERRVSSATDSLAQLMAADDATAVAAAEALGRIGGKDAVRALGQPHGQGALRRAVDRALLSCSEQARLSGSKDTAYPLLLSPETEAHVRAAAFYGCHLAGGDKSVEAAVAALKGSDGELSRAAARLIRDMPDKDMVTAAAAALPELKPENQIVGLAALAERGDRRAQEGVLKLTASADAEVRIAALRALESLGDKQAVAGVMQVMTAPDVDRESLKAARKALATMNGQGVDKAIVAQLRTADAKAKVECVKALGARKARGAMDELLAAARDADAALAEEARGSISLMARAEDLPAVVALLAATADADGQRYLESVVVKAAKTAADERAKTAAVLKALKQELPVPARCSLLLALGRMDAPSGLPALLAAAKDGDPVVRRAAFKSIAENWPDAEPLPVLRDASRSDPDEPCRVQALSGYARMLTLPSKRPVKETLNLYREALALVKSATEKRALLGGLGSLIHKDALEFVKPYLTDASVSADAFRAALSISDGLNGGAMVLTSSLKGAERNALDGDPKTRWTTGSSTTGGEWFQVDLGYEDDLRTVYLDAGPVGNDQPKGYEVYVSLDGANWGVPVATGGDPKKKAFSIDFAPKYGRYLKVVQTKPHGNNWSINEIRVNGVPEIKSYPALPRAQWKASASTAPGNDKPERAIDGDLTKRWGTGRAMKPNDWFAVDMGEEHTVHGVVMDAAKSGDYPREFQIFTSMDGQQWYGPVGTGQGKGPLTKAAVLPTKARHVKIVQTGSAEANWWSIYDLQILGE